MSRLSLSFQSPQDAVFLRILAWELYVAKRELTVKDVVDNQLIITREELGLSKYKANMGGSHDYIQNLRKGIPKISAKNTFPEPLDPFWRIDWRLHYQPSHSAVRKLRDRKSVV